jgi:hypothetical protein
MRRSLLPLLLVLVLVLGGCSRGMAGFAARALFAGAIVATTLAFVHHAHQHHYHCGHHYVVVEEEPVYYYEGRWEAYDHRSGRWYVYEGAPPPPQEYYYY